MIIFIHAICFPLKLHQFWIFFAYKNYLFIWNKNDLLARREGEISRWHGVACDDAQWRNKTTIQKKAIDNCLLVTIKDSIESFEGRMIHLSQQGRTLSLYTAILYITSKATKCFCPIHYNSICLNKQEPFGSFARPNIAKWLKQQTFFSSTEIQQMCS